MSAIDVERDERTVATENASYRWGFLELSFGLLVAAGYRGFVLNESAWDLLALVILGGAVTTIYQAGGRILSRRWATASIIAVLVAALAAFAVVSR